VPTAGFVVVELGQAFGNRCEATQVAFPISDALPFDFALIDFCLDQNAFAVAAIINCPSSLDVVIDQHLGLCSVPGAPTSFGEVRLHVQAFGGGPFGSGAGFSCNVPILSTAPLGDHSIFLHAYAEYEDGVVRKAVQSDSQGTISVSDNGACAP